MSRWQIATLLMLAVLLLLIAIRVQAQSGGVYNLSKWTIDGGGATISAGGNYTLGGASGQPDAGLMNGDGFVLAGGFWQSGGGTGQQHIYLPLIRK